MPEDPRIMADIERDERWLRSCAPVPPAPRSMEHVKFHVRIALGESRLEASPTPPVEPACVARVKRAVRDELTRRAGRGRRFPRRRLLPLAVGGPLAAAAVLAVVLLVERPNGDSPSPNTYTALDALVELAEDSSSDPADTVPLPDIDALEEEMRWTWSTGSDNGWEEGDTVPERLYEKLRDELDTLRKPGTIMRTGDEYPWLAARAIESSSGASPA